MPLTGKLALTEGDLLAIASDDASLFNIVKLRFLTLADTC